MPAQNETKEERDERPRLPRMGGADDGRKSSIVLWVVLVALALFWGWNLFTAQNLTQIDYSEFRQQLRGGNVERVTVSGSRIEGVLGDPSSRVTGQGDTLQFTEFLTHLPSFGDDELLSMLEEQGVEVETQPPSDFSWWPFLLMGLPFILFLMLGYAFFSRMQNQGQSLFSIKKNQAKLYDQETAKTTFDDVAGCESAKEELKEIVAYLTKPDSIRRLGGKVPKGVLLVGPPGTGKTLLARAVAGEAGVPFFSITGSDFMEMFVGVGASRVRDLFKDAKEASPAIIFIDELDSIGRQRGAGLGGGHDEREQTLNQLLSELDGFEPTEDVIVMAATNRPDILDPALLRPGRFDRRVTVDLPTQHDRAEILQIHAREKPLDDDIDMDEIARSTPGFSGADLENLLNEAALHAVRYDHESIQRDDVDEAIDKIMMGLERKGLILTDEERRMLAYHEAGHALVAAVLEHADPVHKVTIVPRGRAMGVTQQLPKKDKYIYRREYMLDRLAVMMGGRAAEDLIFDTATSGAENDLKQVIGLSRKMVLDWGMSDRFKNIAFGGQREQVFLGEQISQRREYSEDTARSVDGEIEKIIDQAYTRALDTLKEHHDALDAIADHLLDEEEMPGSAVLEILGIEPEKARATDGDRSQEAEANEPGAAATSQAANSNAATVEPESGSAASNGAGAIAGDEPGDGEPSMDRKKEQVD